jgi:hypothetical protein
VEKRGGKREEEGKTKLVGRGRRKKYKERRKGVPGVHCWVVEEQ